MSTRRAVYLDSSAIVKLVLREQESEALRRYLRSRRPLVSSSLARTEVMRSLQGFDGVAFRRGRQVLTGINLIRISDRILDDAGRLEPHQLRPLDAIHVTSALSLGRSMATFVTYDERLTAAAQANGLATLSPGRSG